MTETTDSAIAPRKKAKQRRSRERVEHILDTVLTMLSEGPADKLTTNGIAQRANVSIGSLYQFFPNKEAIFYELFQRWLEQTLASLDHAYNSLGPGSDKNDCVEAILEALGGPTSINSTGHWQLRRAMGSSRKLAELEEHHLGQIFQRIMAFQSKFGTLPPPEKQRDLALLQNQICIACLQVLALTKTSPNRESVLNWCRHTLLLVFDYQMLDRPLVAEGP
ncbi:MAG: TetR/AcrR family transcriptional regulator [Pseudomonadota bacterium]|nr:TetR/AcrR family transcriptional regulator [Pseudomonadota bacterium]